MSSPACMASVLIPTTARSGARAGDAGRRVAHHSGRHPPATALAEYYEVPYKIRHAL